MKKIILWVMLVLMLSACGDAEEGQSERDSAVPLQVGEELEIDFVKHIENDEYDLGVFSGPDKVLKWRTAPYDLYSTWSLEFTVVEDTTIQKAVLKRHENKGKDTAVYVLHIPEKYAMEGATYTENCGKACTKTITTKMIVDTK